MGFAELSAALALALPLGRFLSRLMAFRAPSRATPLRPTQQHSEEDVKALESSETSVLRSESQASDSEGRGRRLVSAGQRDIWRAAGSFQPTRPVKIHAALRERSQHAGVQNTRLLPPRDRSPH